MEAHECVQAERIRTVESDIRALAKSTNGKLDKIWGAVDELQDQAATSKANLKWLAIIVLQLGSIVLWIVKS